MPALWESAVVAHSDRDVTIALVSCSDRREASGGDAATLTRALAGRGADVAWVGWDDAARDWAAFDLVALWSTRDRTGRADAFRAWVVDVAIRTTLVNPPRLVLGTLHRSYLADMGDHALPALAVPAGMTVDLAHCPWPGVVVKPALGVEGTGVVHDATQADLDALTLAPGSAVDVVLQPDVTPIGGLGTMAVACVDGEPTHAVRTKPTAGDLGAPPPAEPEPLTDRHAAAARRALAALPDRPIYARVDLVEHGGDLFVAELGLVDAHLWLEHAPQAADRLATTLCARARASRR